MNSRDIYSQMHLLFPPESPVEMRGFIYFTNQHLISKKKANLPSWIGFPLKSFKNKVKYCASVTMGQYLIILVQVESFKPPFHFSVDSEEDEDSASLLAFDLKDHTVQKAEIDVNLFANQDEYSFIKCGENQILRYYSRCRDDKKFVRITVESFKRMVSLMNFVKNKLAFKVRCEKLKANKREFESITAQIFQNCLYTYGQVSQLDKNELWSFNPNSMTWKKIEQKDKYLANHGGYKGKNGGALYKDHLVTLKDQLGKKENTLCCLNLKTKNTWSTFDINGLGRFKDVRTDSLMVENGSLLAFATYEHDLEMKYDFTLQVLNLENFEICHPKSAGEEKISSLFMSETDSDIAFQIEGQTIHAHKSVLKEKSPYFESLFDIGMSESTQDIIEIQNCEYDIFKGTSQRDSFYLTFKECLRFIYQGTVDFGDDINRAIKLFNLADKYLVPDLYEKCISFLAARINMENIYQILDFANQPHQSHRQNIPQIIIWCTKLFKDNLNIQNVNKLVNYIVESSQKVPHFKDSYKELIEKAITFTADNFSMIYENENGNMRLYENFLVNNIGMKTISSCAKCLGGFDELPEDKKHLFESCTRPLKESVLRFVQENLEIIMKSPISKSFPIAFFEDFILYQSNQMKNSKKRMESTKDDVNEESPELKKTKK